MTSFVSKTDSYRPHLTPTPERLRGKVALITGGVRGIGRAIAQRYAEEGAGIAVVDQDVGSPESRAASYQADVANRQQVEGVVNQVLQRFGHIDILVNNAGTFFSARFEDLTDEQWDGILNANLKSQFLCAQAAAPIMKRQGRGRIINLSSLGGMLPWPSYTHYCVSKAGVIMLTRCLARALAPEILVNSVAPGTIQFPGESPDAAWLVSRSRR